MKKYFCNPCGYTYDPEKGDPEHGIAPGTAFAAAHYAECIRICSNPALITIIKIKDAAQRAASFILYKSILSKTHTLPFHFPIFRLFHTHNRLLHLQ